jgi:2,4-dienoyl-CoA reductase-like NADH-dependent reductase (Old Yellow Enzyme family)/thioredoxin reductase
MKYQNLLRPMKIGNIVLKNRLTASPGKPHYIQGPEPYPAEGTITHYANKAKNGAALITCNGTSPVPLDPNKFFTGNTRNSPWMQNHGTEFDIFEGHCQHYLSHMTETIHFYGSRALANINPSLPPGYDVSSGVLAMAVKGSGNEPQASLEITEDLLEKVAENYVLQASILKKIGFDGLFIHMAYRFMFMGRFLSPLSNRRTDKFGGSPENRVRFPLMVADRIKQKCGKDFIIEASISGCESEPGGLTLEDTIEYARMFAGHIEMIQVRAGNIDPAHPTGFTLERTPFLYMAEAIKKSGANILVGTVGGYLDLDTCEDVIASGKADYIAMARSWISNPDYGRKAYEGRNEDVVPCIRCNKCHRSSHADPWTSVCSVNPVWGFEHKIERMIDPPAVKKKIAIVGGGPAGMKAALTASERGHQVMLYEKSEALGGLLNTSDNVSFKWPVKKFKDYLVRQIGKSNVKVCLNTEATPETLRTDQYDAVLAAVGSEPIIPAIPGVDRKNVMLVTDVYGKEAYLSGDVVIIGGGEVGVETGMHLAENGHRVTVLEMRGKLAPDSTPLHYYSMFKEAWEKLENFSYILHALCTSIENDHVTYRDKEGKEHKIKAGNVVLAAGMKPKNDLALRFYGSGDSFFMIGDCIAAGNIQKVMRSAFSIASML